MGVKLQLCASALSGTRILTTHPVDVTTVNP